MNPGGDRKETLVRIEQEFISSIGVEKKKKGGLVGKLVWKSSDRPRRRI